MSKGKNEGGATALWKKKVAEKEYLDLIFKRQPAAKAVLPTVVETLKDVTIGAIAGSYLGTTLFGKYSFWGGLATTIAGHATGWNMASSLGIGMMACGGKNVVGVDGLNGFNKEAFKARNTAFLETWKEKFVPGMPKFSKDKSVGNVDEFNYSRYKEASGTIDLNKLEEKLMQSARNYREQAAPSMSGTFGEVEFSERIY